MTAGGPGIPGRAALVAEAVAAAGLDDFGDPWLFENLDALISSLNADAQLTSMGAAAARGMILGALGNRLRHVNLLARNPEILQERVRVAAVVVSLPRTGSTMLHRMLASAPGMTGMRWFEAQNYAPLAGERRGDPSPRREAAQAILDYMLTHAPDLMSVHPMSLDQPDEELIALGLLFSSTMAEGTYFVPGFARWLIAHSRTRCYADLRQILQSLQWQDTGRRDARWVLKTPGHLIGLKGVLATFPEARIVMTHRDPLAVVPSFCSMMATLYGMNSTVDRHTIGAFWLRRLAEWLALFMADRDQADPARFIDVRYSDIVRQPVEEGTRVLKASGIAVTPALVAGMQDWIEANRREDRAPHRYTLEAFGLEREQVEETFAAYRARFLG